MRNDLDLSREHPSGPHGLYLGLSRGLSGVAMELDPPPAWPCLADEVEAVLISHPEFDLEDAVFALIWGLEEDDEH